MTVIIIPSFSNEFSFCKNTFVLNVIEIETLFRHLLCSSGHIVKLIKLVRKKGREGIRK